MCTCIIYCLHVVGYNMFRPTLAIFRYITGIPGSGGVVGSIVLVTVVVVW
jgi:hypothetical protein